MEWVGKMNPATGFIDLTDPTAAIHLMGDIMNIERFHKVDEFAQWRLHHVETNHEAAEVPFIVKEPSGLKVNGIVDPINIKDL